MTDLGHKIAGGAKEIVTWKETWIPLSLGAVVLWVIFILSMMVTVRDTIIKQMAVEMGGVERQVEALKAQAEVVRVQNQTSINDRSYIRSKIESSSVSTAKEIQYLHDELENTRAALKRLEARK